MSLTDEWNNKQEPGRGLHWGGPHITPNLSGLAIRLEISQTRAGNGYFQCFLGLALSGTPQARFTFFCGIALLPIPQEPWSPRIRYTKQRAWKRKQGGNLKNDLDSRQGSGLIFMASVLVRFRATPAPTAPFHLLPFHSARFHRRDTKPMPRMCCFGFCQLKGGTVAGSGEPAFGTNRLGRWKLPTCTESKFGVFPAHLWSGHARPIIFSSLKSMCFEIQLKRNNQEGTPWTHSASAKGAHPRQGTYNRAEQLEPTQKGILSPPQLKVISNASWTST